MSPKVSGSKCIGDAPALPVSVGGSGVVGGLGSVAESDPSCIVDLEAKKPELRRRFLQEARRIPSHERVLSSEQLVAHLTALPELQAARRLALYSPLGEEPLLDGLAERLVGEGREVYLPAVVSKSDMLFCRFESQKALEVGRMGILEPGLDAPVAAPGSLDVIVIPALAYDHHGVRLGRGKGYYDRTVPHFIPRATLVGVCFSQSLVVSLPREAWDLRVAYVVTEAGVRVSYTD